MWASGRTVIAVALVLTGCGRAPTPLGVMVNEAAVTKTRVDPGALVPGDGGGVPDGIGGPTMHEADVVGDEETETLVALPRGQGIEVRDRNGRRVAAIAASGYLTDFGVLPPSRPGTREKQDLVLYVYPNISGGGTFTVITPDERELASWEERSPPGRFTIGRWDGDDAIVYLRSGQLVIRARDARQLVEVAVPASDPYDVRRTIAVGEHTVVLASGGGYTPFHMVLVIGRDGRLMFAEVDRDHAFGLRANGSDTFVVHTRSGRWQYSLPGARVP